MERFTKISIKNNIVRALSEGHSNADICAQFLMMKMTNDIGDENPFISKTPTLVDIYDNLLGNGVIDNKDFGIENNPQNIFKGMFVESLIVKLSPACHLHVERTRQYLRIIINDCAATMYIKHLSAKDVALWMIRQKKKLDKYLKEWEKVILESAKTAKGNHMTFLAIKAIFTEAMKDYPKLKYEIVEQQRKARIKVEIPNSNLGVCIDGWWGSYQQHLPQQIESLKILIDTHRNSSLKAFFTTRYIH